MAVVSGCRAVCGLPVQVVSFCLLRPQAATGRYTAEKGAIYTMRNIKFSKKTGSATIFHKLLRLKKSFSKRKQKKYRQRKIQNIE